MYIWREFKELDLSDLWGPFQTKPSYDSKVFEGVAEKIRFSAMYVRGGPHLRVEVHSCWYFKFVIHQQSLNYPVKIILPHSHIMPAWLHHNNIPVIICAAVKSKKVWDYENINCFSGSRVTKLCTLDNVGSVLLLVHCCTLTCSNSWERNLLTCERVTEPAHLWIWSTQTAYIGKK